VRFFDEGAVLVNFAPKDVTVTAEQIAALPGWQGPYYRFQGGQDPVTNNGAAFERVTLKGHAYGPLNAVFGDALLLVKKPTTAVSDIVIDNCDSGTSPGSRAAVLSDGWVQQGCGVGSDHYTLRCAEFRQSYGFALAQPGPAAATAIFRPSIGLTGNYEVFEWHGRLAGPQAARKEATNVPCTITCGGGRRTLAINQRSRAGQWNSLGIFPFAQGTSGDVTIGNRADGPVMADAVKFVYRRSGR
jgi:hypothetical protein